MKDRDIYVRGVPENLKVELKNIAKNLGISMGDLIKPKLRELAESYPEKMKMVQS